MIVSEHYKRDDAMCKPSPNASLSASMVRMLVDTSIWLGLASDPKDVALVGTIERLVAEGLLSLIVPTLVLREFRANRERVAAEYGKRFSSHFRTVREAIEMASIHGIDIEATLRIVNQIEQGGGARTKLAAQVFSRIEKLLDAAAHVDASEAVKLAVFERAIEGRAPFHQGENEAADAVLIEIYADSVRGAADEEGTRHMFVTRNTEHFSADRSSQKKPHSDFSCFSERKSEYFISLPDALSAVAPSRSAELLQIWEAEQPTVADLIGRYIDEPSKKKPLGVTHKYALQALRKRPIAMKVAAKLQSRDIVEHCRSRVQDGEVDPSTVRQDLTCLRGVLAAAEDRWEVLGVSADVVNEAWRELEKLELVGYSTMRDRRPTADEIQRLIAHFRQQDKHPRTKIRMCELTEFALATGRPLGQICELGWADFNEVEKTCRLRGKSFPLLDEAVSIIKRQRREGDEIFPYGTTSVTQRFVQSMRTVGIKGLRFHDLRREAVLRMFEAEIQIERVSALTGLGLLSLERYRTQLRQTGSDLAPWGTVGWKRQRSRRKAHSL